MFQSNKAQIGGVGRAIGIDPLYTNCQFYNNKATLYGDFTVTFPKKIVLSLKNLYFPDENNIIFINDFVFVSGQKVESLLFKLSNEEN